MRLLGFAPGAVLAALALAAPAPAQEPMLDVVDALITNGRTEDARGVLIEWWNASGAPRGAAARVELQRALWLRGLLTVDPTQAVLDYQRLVVEYPGGPWSDQALLRLAQTAAARGEPARARDQLHALLRDYPGSAHRSDAELLLASVEASPGFAAGPAASEPAGAAVASVGEPVSSPALRPDPDPAPPPAEPEPNDSWTVQVGAFASPERAGSLRAELTAIGIEARVVVVPGSQLLRVRTGRFTDEDQAHALRRGLLARGFDATVSRDADQEEAAP